MLTYLSSAELKIKLENFLLIKFLNLIVITLLYILLNIIVTQEDILILIPESFHYSLILLTIKY